MRRKKKVRGLCNDIYIVIIIGGLGNSHSRKIRSSYHTYWNSLPRLGQIKPAARADMLYWA